MGQVLWKDFYFFNKKHLSVHSLYICVQVYFQNSGSNHSPRISMIWQDLNWRFHQGVCYMFIPPSSSWNWNFLWNFQIHLSCYHSPSILLEFCVFCVGFIYNQSQISRVIGFHFISSTEKTPTFGLTRLLEDGKLMLKSYHLLSHIKPET